MSPWSKVLLGRSFICGDGCQLEQLSDFSNRDGVIEERDGFIALPYSPDAWVPWRVQSSTHEGRKLVEKGKGYATHTATVKDLIAWTKEHTDIQNVNNYFECLLGEADLGLDIAICLAFDVDLKHGNVIDKLPSPEYFYKQEIFLPWIIDKILAFLKDTYGEEVSSRQLRVSASNKAFQEDQLDFILDRTKKNGVQSYHILVEHLVLRNMEERKMHGDAVREYFSDLDGIVDPGVYSMNRNMRCLGAQKLDKVPLMPVKSIGGMVFADEAEYESWFDIPPETVLKHMWTIVPPDVRGMDFSRIAASATTSTAMAEWARTARAGETRTGHVVGQQLTSVYEEAVALYVAFAAQRCIGFDTSSCTYSMRRDDECSFEVHAKLLPGKQRPCLVMEDSGQPRIHGSNHFKLKVRKNGCVEYVCYGSARPSALLDEVKSSDTSGTGGRVKARLTLGNSYCCSVHIGRLCKPLFEIDADAALEATPDGKLAKFRPRIWLEENGLPASTVVILRPTYGSGKTWQIIQEIIAVLRANPSARIGYVSNLKSTVASLVKLINEALRAAGLPQRLTYYQECDKKGRTSKAAEGALVAGNIGFVCMSACKVVTDHPGRPFDLLVFDEAEACVRMMDSLHSPRGSPLQEMVRILSTAKAVRMLDADGDVYCKLMANLAQRGSRILDAPKCKPFSGAEFTIHGAFRNDSFSYCQHAVFKRLLTTLDDPNVKHAAIACTTLKDVFFVDQALRLVGHKPNVCYGGLSEAAKRAFLDAFTSSIQPTDKSIWIYSPCIGPAVSNTFCDTVCLVWRTKTQAMSDMSQSAWRCRGAKAFHAFVMEKLILTADLPQARPCGMVVYNECIDGQILTRIAANNVPNFVTCALLLDEAGISREHKDINLCDYFYSKCHDKVVWRYVLAPPQLLESAERAAEGVVLADAGKHHLRTGCTLREAQEHFVASMPTEWRNLLIEDAPDFIRLRQKLESINRPRSLWGYFKQVCSRGGVTIKPANIEIVTGELANEHHEWVKRCVLAHTLRKAAEMAAFYNTFVRPTVETIPSQSFLDDAACALRGHTSDEDRVSTAVAQRLATMGADARDRYGPLKDLPFAPGLLDMVAIAAEDGGGEDDDLDVDAPAPSEEAIRLAGLRPWVRPVLTFGPDIINATVDDMLDSCDALALSLVSEAEAEAQRRLRLNMNSEGSVADEGDKAAAVTHPYTAVFAKLREFTLLFNNAFVMQHFCKRILVTKDLKLSDRDTLTYLGVKFIHMERLRALNDVLGVITDDGRSIVGVHGAEVPHMFTSEKAIDGRNFSEERKTLELKRMRALSTFHSNFLVVNSSALKIKHDSAAKVVLQWALNTMEGTYSVVPMKGVRPSLVIRADPLTKRADKWLLNAHEDGVLAEMHLTEVTFWREYKNDERPNKRTRHDDTEHDDMDDENDD